MVAVIWEQIWSIGNKVIFQKAKVKIDVFLAIIEKKFQEHVTVLEQQHSNKSSGQINSWQAPHSNVFKINCDATLSNKVCCIAIVIRDWKGNVIVADTRMETKASVSVAEAKSLGCALVMTKLLKLRKVEVEGDSKIYIDALNKVSLKNHDHIDKLEARTMFEDILDLANEMDHVRFNWVKREVNEAAHLLAKWGLVNNWNATLPDQFVSVIRRDVPGCLCFFVE
jgi:ribonuclease HI